MFSVTTVLFQLFQLLLRGFRHFHCMVVVNLVPDLYNENGQSFFLLEDMVKYRRKRGYGKRKRTSVTKGVKKYVKKAIASNIEYKLHRSLSDGGVDSYGTLYSFTTSSQIGRGTALYQRTGNEIILKRFKIGFQAYNADASLGFADVYTTIRIVIAFSNIIPTLGNAVAFIPSTLFPPKYEEFPCKIIYDTVFHLTSTLKDQTASPYVRTWRINKKLHHKVHFRVDDTNKEGMLWMLAISDSSAPPHPRLRFDTALYFQDG